MTQTNPARGGCDAIRSRGRASHQGRRYLQGAQMHTAQVVTGSWFGTLGAACEALRCEAVAQGEAAPEARVTRQRRAGAWLVNIGSMAATVEKVSGAVPASSPWCVTACEAGRRPLPGWAEGGAHSEAAQAAQAASLRPLPEAEAEALREAEAAMLVPADAIEAARQAAQRVAEARQRRAAHARTSEAAGSIAAMSRSMGADAVGLALVEAVERAHQAGSDTAPGLVLADAWSQTREAAQRQRRSDQRRERREREATGAVIADACAACHGSGQTSEVDADGEALRCDACRGSGRESAEAREARVIAAVCEGLTQTQAQAVAAAFAADGPLTTSDHDPAGCPREGCKRCEAVRSQMAGALSGPLAQAPRKAGQRRRRPARADRVIPEHTSDRTPAGMPGKEGSVTLASEAPLVRLLDTTRAHYAKGATSDTSDHTGQAACAGPQAAMVLADLSIIPQPGPKGREVDWTGMGALYGLRAEALEALRLRVSALVLAHAFAPGSGRTPAEAEGAQRAPLVTGSDLVRLARAANLSAADLATAITASERAPLPAMLPMPRSDYRRPAHTAHSEAHSLAAHAVAIARGATASERAQRATICDQAPAQPGSEAWREAASLVAALPEHSEAAPASQPASVRPAPVDYSQAPARTRRTATSAPEAQAQRPALVLTRSAAHRRCALVLCAWLAGGCV